MPHLPNPNPDRPGPGPEQRLRNLHSVVAVRYRRAKLKWACPDTLCALENRRRRFQMIRHSSDGTTNRSGQLAILRYSVRTAYLELLELRERVRIAEAKPDPMPAANERRREIDKQG